MLSHPLLSLGFRPFFLLAGGFAALWLPLWLLAWSGTVPLPAHLGPIGWHRHEMLFGYTLAVIAGFLLTAAGNWTGRPMPGGGRLLGLVALWIVPRLALPFTALAPPSLRWAVAALDVAFPLAVAAALAPALWGSRSLRNFGFLPVLGALAAANGVVHAEALGLIPPEIGAGNLATRFALDAIVLIMVVMGGRVIPFFTGNALPEAGVTRSVPADRAAVGFVAAMTLADLAFGFEGAAEGAGALALCAAAANAWRMVGWRSLATGRAPILWVLHAAFAWIVFGLALKGLAAFWPEIPSVLPTHALTVGGIGGLTLGMMARVALGHSGRPLHVAPAIVWAFVLVNVSALARVAPPLFLPSAYFASLVISGALWTAAFAVFAAIYAPILFAPRQTPRRA